MSNNDFKMIKELQGMKEEDLYKYIESLYDQEY